MSVNGLVPMESNRQSTDCVSERNLYELNDETLFGGIHALDTALTSVSYASSCLTAKSPLRSRSVWAYSFSTAWSSGSTVVHDLSLVWCVAPARSPRMRAVASGKLNSVRKLQAIRAAASRAARAVGKSGLEPLNTPIIPGQSSVEGCRMLLQML